MLLFYFGLSSLDQRHGGNLVAAYALAFSAGTFLCISSSDLLPELQFHQHDRGKLSAALLAGLGVAIAVAQLEEAAHGAPRRRLSRQSTQSGQLIAPAVKLFRTATGVSGAMRSVSPACLTVESVVSVESGAQQHPNG